MSYRVRWNRFARNQLATVWLSAPDRMAVTQASHRIDQTLAQRGPLAGEQRTASTWVLADRPLFVLYSANETTRFVVVRYLLALPSRS